MSRQGVFDAEHRALTVGVILMITLVAFEALATATVMPAAEDDLGGLGLYAWSFSAFLLAGVVGIAVAGGEADRLGPARPFAFGLALFAVGLAVAGLAPAMWVLVIGRAIQGFGGGFVPTIVYVIVGRAYPDELRPRMFALFSTAWVLPGLVGPSLAGFVADYLSWRLAFLGILPLVGFAAALILPPLHSLDRPEPAGRPNRTRALQSLRLAGGIALLLGGLALRHPLFGPPLIGVGVVVAYSPLKALLPAGSLTLARGLPAAVAGLGLLNIGFLGADSFVPYTLVNLRDQSSVVAGLIITVAALSWTGGSWIVERGSKRFARRTFVSAGMLSLASGTLGLAFLPFEGTPVLLALPAWLLAGLGMGLAYPNFGLIALAEAPAGAEGEASSSLKLADYVGAAIGAGVAGAIIAAGEARGAEAEALSLNFVLMAGIVLFGLMAAMRLPGHVVEAPPGPALEAAPQTS